MCFEIDRTYFIQYKLFIIIGDCGHIRQLLHRGHRFTLCIDPKVQPHSSDVGKSELPRRTFPTPRCPFSLKIKINPSNPI